MCSPLKIESSRSKPKEMTARRPCGPECETRMLGAFKFGTAKAQYPPVLRSIITCVDHLRSCSLAHDNYLNQRDVADCNRSTPS
jgi:hypothetical protein